MLQAQAFDSPLADMEACGVPTSRSALELLLSEPTAEGPAALSSFLLSRNGKDVKPHKVPSRVVRSAESRR